MLEGLNRIDQEWVPLQIKVFTRWVVSHLNGQGTVKVEDVTKDLSNGVALIELAQILTHKTATRPWKKRPKTSFEQVQNCDLALQMFQNDGVVLVGMSGKDINDSKEKLVLGLIWTLILHYSIGASVSADTSNSSTRKTSSAGSGKALKSWAIERTKDYKYVHEFLPFDMGVCALLNSYYPNELVYNNLDPSKSQENLLEACKVMNNHGINILVYPEDLKESDIDEKTLLTQLSAVKTVVDPTPLTTTTTRSVTTTTSSSHSNSSTTSNYSSITSDNAQQRSVSVQERNAPVDGDNSQYAGRKFALVMSLPADEFNRLQTDPSKRINGASTVNLALTLVDPEKCFLNPAGLKLDLRHPNVDYDRNQQFTFGKDNWNTVIDSFARPGMVWDVANQYDLDPPEGTEFYLFPFHGRHNQHFVFKDGHIYAKQNGHVITYDGGDKPFSTRKASSNLNARQTFQIRLL